MAQPQSAQGQNRIRASTARPDLAREQGGSRRALAKARDGVGQSAVCGAPSDPLDETRDPAKRAVYRGRRPLVLFANKERVFPKSLAPARRGGETPSRAEPSLLFG